MVLSAGIRLGNYEIQEAVGAGGMGEVYRARDTRLNRDVALKVLPQAFVLDADRLARFKREAQLLASLNHANIAAIYGFEEASGCQALILEFVDGPTLADRITAGPIPVDDAVSISTQIADALQAAHDQGIIHRDLKPANVKVRDDGTVKVLDFGLAKMADASGSIGGNNDDRHVRLQPDFSASPTITTPAMTMAGVLLGTAAYMSPEQAKGRPADKRSDIWAFGCVLFEMLSGRKAFDGEDVTDTIAAVVRAEPPWSALPDDVPASIQLFLRRCLEKDRKKRIGDIAVAQFLLSEHPRLAAPRSRDVHPPWMRPRLHVWFLLVAAMVTTLIGAAIGWALRPRPLPPAIIRFSHTLPSEDRLTGLQRHELAVSPDGSQIVYVANGRLYCRPVGDLQSRVIPGTEDLLSVMGPVFSPDGQWIAYHGRSASEEAIQRIPLIGGSPTTILPTTASPTGMSWDESGILYGAGREGVFRIAASGGTPEQLIRLDEDQAAWGPQLLPGGNAVLFTLVSAPQGIQFPQWDNARIVVQTLASGERKTIVDGASDARYLTSGHLVFAVSGSLFAVAFDPTTASVIGDRVPILAGIRRGSATGAAQFSVSTNGSLAYIPGPVNATFTRRSLNVFDSSGTITRLRLPPARYEHPRVSPDGARIALVNEDDESADISIYEMAETSALRRLTIGGHNNFPVWSSDSERIAFQSDREGDRGIFWQRADGLGTAERLTTATKDTAHIPESVSRDGKYLLFSELKSGTYSLRVLSIEDKSSMPFGNVTSVEPTGAVFSPDGRWVAYASTTRASELYSPNRGVFIQPFPATGVPYQVPKVRIDYHPAWSPDGKSLFFIAAAPQPLVVVNVNTRPSVTFGVPAELPPTIPRPARLSGSARDYDILPDGRVLILVPVDQDSAGGTIQSEVRVVVNWIEELKRMVPR